MIKTFLSANGETIGGRHADHADTARAYLASKGIVAKDYTDLYTQMFALGFARVSQELNQFHIERPSGFSRAQKKVIENKVAAGFNVFVNDRRYTESKERNASTLGEQITGEPEAGRGGNL